MWAIPLKKEEAAHTDKTEIKDFKKTHQTNSKTNLRIGKEVCTRQSVASRDESPTLKRKYFEQLQNGTLFQNLSQEKRLCLD